MLLEKSKESKVLKWHVATITQLLSQLGPEIYIAGGKMIQVNLVLVPLHKKRYPLSLSLNYKVKK
jgi:hypothetical protein